MAIFCLRRGHANELTYELFFYILSFQQALMLIKQTYMNKQSMFTLLLAICKNLGTLKNDRFSIKNIDQVAKYVH